MKSKSKFRKSYINRLIFRTIVFIIMIGIYTYYPNAFEVSKGANFIKMFSPLHIIWLIWIIDMIFQLCKMPEYWPLGSQKYWGYRFQSNKKCTDIKAIKKQMKKMNKEVIAIAISWILVVLLIAELYLNNIISYQVVILCSIAFYVCDIICVVGWCPFQKFYMHNKCCTTCRIFNWDHAMMFTPLIVIPGIWTYSLLAMALIVLTVWEVTCAVHPERFIEKTNCALQCKNCNDKLCGK